MLDNSSLNFYPVLYQGSKTITPDMVGITNAYHTNTGYLDPTPSTYGWTRHGAVYRHYGAGAYWPWVEKLKGQYDTAVLDADTQACLDYSALGKTRQMYLGATPGWANENMAGFAGTTTPVSIPTSLPTSVTFACDNLEHRLSTPAQYVTLGSGSDNSYNERITVHSTVDPSIKMSGVVTAASATSITLLIDAVQGTGSGITSWKIMRWYGQYHNMAPTNWQDFADWVTFIGNYNEAHWNGCVRMWFFQNEPAFGNLVDSTVGPYYGDSAESYAIGTRIMYQILKSINPLNMISGCDGPYINQRQYQRFLAAGTSGAAGQNVISVSYNIPHTLFNGWNIRSVSGDGYLMPFDTKVVSVAPNGSGGTYITIDKNLTSSVASQALDILEPVGYSLTKRFLTASAQGFNAGFGDGAGTRGADWVDAVSIHSYIDYPYSWSPQNEKLNAYEWMRFKQMLASIGVNKPIWQTEIMQIKTGGAFTQYNSLYKRFFRNAISAIAVGGCSRVLCFDWGFAQWAMDDLTPTRGSAAQLGHNARADWDAFWNRMYASPWTKVELDFMTEQYKITQANGTITYV